jgi:hypothetical protein
MLPRTQILVGNKVDMAPEKRAVSYARGKALAEEYGIQFFEASAKSAANVDEVGRGWACCPPPLPQGVGNHAACPIHTAVMSLLLQFRTEPRCYC